MTKQFKLAFAASFVAGVLALSACSAGGPGGGDSAAGADDVSGTLVWYSSHNPEQNELLVEAFNEEYPNVDVQVLRLVTGELSVRYSQEREANTSSADVVTLADGAMVDEGFEKDWWVTDAKPADGWPDDAYRDGRATVGLLPMITAINTDLVEDEPTTWEDLLDPEYKNQILLADPRNVPAYLATVELWSQEYGDDFLTDLAAQDPQLIASTVPGNETLGAGGAKIVVPNSMPGIQTIVNAGAPIKPVPISPYTASEYYAVIASNAQNPTAAAAFYEFLTSKEGQEAFNGAVTVSVRDDTEGTGELPEGFVPLEELLPTAIERRAELLGLLGIE